LKNPHNCVLASLKPSTYSAVRFGLSLAAALLQGFLKRLQLGMLKQTVTLFRARASRFTNDEQRSEGIAL
jgi:hypothetical protein